MVVRYQKYQNYTLLSLNSAKSVSGASDSSGSSGASGVSGLSGLDISRQIEQIKNELSRGFISIDEGIKRFKDLGIIPNVSCSDNKTTISFEYEGKEYTFIVTNGAYHYANALEERDVNHWEELQQAISSMGLIETQCRGVYCEVHNPDMPANDQSHRIHYVWNDSTCEMIELTGIYNISKSGHETKGVQGYEQVRAYLQRYQFTDKSGIYEKDGKQYRFDVGTNKFVEPDISSILSRDDYSKQEKLDFVVDFLTQGKISEDEAADAIFALFGERPLVFDATDGRRVFSSFDDNGKQYAVAWLKSVADGTRTTNLDKYTEEQLLSYTNDMDLINEYFTMVYCDSDNKTLYMLKDGFSFELFLFEKRFHGDEFDRVAGKDENWQYVNEYVEIFINELQSEHDYSEEYIETIRGFAKRQFTLSYTSTENQARSGRKKYTIKDYLTSIKSDLDSIMHPTGQECYSNWFSKNNVNNFIIYIMNSLSAGIDNLSIDTQTFRNLLTQHIAEKYGMLDKYQKNGYIDFAKLINIDNNNDGNWLNEFYEIAKAFAHRNDGLDIEGAATVGMEFLFKDSDKLTVNEFMANLDNYFISDDPGVIKLQSLIDNAVKKFGINNGYDEEDFIKSIIVIINRHLGIENTVPTTISKSAIEMLNQNDIFAELEAIINSGELIDEYYFGVDGYIDDFGQGQTGDCWLLAALSALSSSEAGRQIIQDSIQTTKNEQGEDVIRVTFKGIGISYDITFEEMVEAREIRDYSDGDNDVQAIELATKKLRFDIQAGKVQINNDATASFYAKDDGLSGLLYGGTLQEMLYYITGNLFDSYYSSQCPSNISNVDEYRKEKMIEYLNSIYDGIINGTLAATVALGFYNNVCANTTNGKIFSWKYGDNHGFGIVGMTENTITIANPWYPDKTYTFTWEEFAKLLPDISTTSTELHELQ